MSAPEIIKELPKLSVAERQAILDKLRELAQVDDDRWEEIINDPAPRPKLQAFIEEAIAEGSAHQLLVTYRDQTAAGMASLARFSVFLCFYVYSQKR